MIINNINVVTLGHNFTEDIVRHPYFGSTDIITDLKRIEGWEEGFIVLKPGCLQYDNNTQLASSLLV